MQKAMKKIILTDDDPGVQDAFRIVLERAGYAVQVFANGNPLLEGAFERPDLIILDKQLSGVDGLDVCRHLKSQPETADVPVVMISATPQAEAWALEAGADAFLEKPFKMKDLLATVARCMEGTPV
jgi:DNA-binding response OmpR family regulator